ncbi:MAG: amidohydrolase family protein [Actinomycetota bacterium]|nr:amidohydrolase family protein [Actinomycetota bacterium]
MDEALRRADELMDQWTEQLRRELPTGADIFDAHVHLGTDIDGFRGDYDELERIERRFGISRAFMFCLDEPDRHPAFRAANDRTLAFAARSGGRLIPFVRLDLTETPVEEATRCLDRGARGIKLHPRAQRFMLNDERLAPVFELAADRRVPILIHGGRGLPPIADHLSRLVERYPEAQLIIAHAGIADLNALAERFAGKAGVFFDTSVWSPIDLLDFYRQISPEQVLYASDYPYGQQPSSLLIALRTARVAGLDDAHVRNMLAGNANRIADGEPPLEPSEPQGSDRFAQPMALARVHQYLSMATPLLWTRQPDTIGIVGLALSACDDRNGHREELEQIKELLTTARDLWRALPEVEDERDRIATSRATFRLIHLADIVAVTAGVSA